MPLIDASEVHEGNIVRLEGKLFKVLSKEARGTGKTARVTHLGLRSIPEGSNLDRNFRPTEKVEEVTVERHTMAYLYSDGSNYAFMDTGTYDQIELPGEIVGKAAPFLKENDEIQVEFCEGSPVSIQFPQFARLRVVTCPPPLHDQETSASKEAELENGMTVLVPQFIKSGDLLEIEVETGKYHSRLKG